MDVRDARVLDLLGEPEIHDAPVRSSRASSSASVGFVFRGGLNVLMSRAFEPIVAATGIVAFPRRLDAFALTTASRSR